MHDFGKIAYLDLQKTGSSFVSFFLNKCCSLEQVRFSKHDWVREDYNPKCFYFITIRNPLSIYSSLYRYGLDNRGGLWKRMNKKNFLSVYDSFDKFVNFLLNEENAKIFGLGYNSEISNLIGFMSFRFLKLSLQFPMKKILNYVNTGKNLQELEKKMITNLEIKQENLENELLNLSQILKPNFFDQNKVNNFFKLNIKLNTSITKEEEISNISKRTYEHLVQKEWLLFSRYN